MHSILLPGATTSAPCERCQRFTQAVFAYGPVDFDGQIVEDVLRSVCPDCGDVLAIAGQSTHRLRSERVDRQAKRTSLRLPLELRDFIGLQLSRAGADPTHVELYFRGLLVTAHHHREALGAALPDVTDPVLAQPLRESVNLTLSASLREVLDDLSHQSGLPASEVMRRLLVLSDADPFASAVQKEVLGLAMAYA